MKTKIEIVSDALYELIQNKEPPWQNRNSTINSIIRARRPTNIIEWFHATNPLKIYFCSCGRLRMICWTRQYSSKVLYPKPPYYSQQCKLCGETNNLIG